MVKTKFTRKLNKISGTSWGIVISKHELNNLKLSEDDLVGGIELEFNVSRTANDILRARRDKEILRRVDAGEVFAFEKDVAEKIAKGEFIVKGDGKDE